MTVAIKQIAFDKPVFVCDCLLCYGWIDRVGRTINTIDVVALVEHVHGYAVERMTEGRFVFVAIDS